MCFAAACTHTWPSPAPRNQGKLTENLDAQWYNLSGFQAILPQLPDFRTTNTFMSCRHWLTSSNTSGHGFKSWTSLNFFQALIFTTGSVVFITARITFIFLYVELVIKKTCCYTLCPSVVNLTALIFLAKLRVVTWSIKKQTQDDNGTEKLKLLLSRDDSSTRKRVLVICDCWIQKINMALFQTNCIISGEK